MIVKNVIKKTLPLFAHAQGMEHITPQWQGCAKLVGKSTTTLNLPDNVSLVTFNVNNIGGSLITQLSATKTKATILGTEITQLPWYGKYKIQLFADHLDTIDTEYVLSLDGLDVLIANDLTGLVDRFLEFKCDILYGASRNKHPDIDIDTVVRRPELGPYCWLNAGTIIAKTESLKAFYKEVVAFSNAAKDNKYNSEQYVVRSVFDDHQDTIKFDSGCELFQTLGSAHWDIDYTTSTMYVDFPGTSSSQYR